MSARKSRRAVFAEVLLLGNPSELRSRQDGVSLAVEFDTIAELRAWMTAAGLDIANVLIGDREGTLDGRPYRAVHAYPTVHGWEIYASATERDELSLDVEVADRLTVLTEDGAQ